MFFSIAIAIACWTISSASDRFPVIPAAIIAKRGEALLHRAANCLAVSIPSVVFAEFNS